MEEVLFTSSQGRLPDFRTCRTHQTAEILLEPLAEHLEALAACLSWLRWFACCASEFAEGAGLGVMRCYDLPVNSLVGFRNFNNFAAQMTTHEDAQIQAIPDYVTLI